MWGGTQDGYEEVGSLVLSQNGYGLVLLLLLRLRLRLRLLPLLLLLILTTYKLVRSF